MIYSLTPGAKEAARKLVEKWNSGELDQELWVLKPYDGGTTYSSTAPNKRGSVLIPEIEMSHLRELAGLNLVEFSPPTKKNGGSKLLLLQALRDAVANDFEQPAYPGRGTTTNTTVSGNIEGSPETPIKIFLSFSRPKGGIPSEVTSIQDVLEKKGYTVIRDPGGISEATEFVESVRNKIQTSDIFCLIINPEAKPSDRIKRDLQWAGDVELLTLPVILGHSRLSYEFLQELGLRAYHPVEYDDSLQANSHLLSFVHNLAEVAREKRQKRQNRKIVLDRDTSLPDYTLFGQQDDTPKPIVNDILGNPSSDPQYRCDVFVIMPFREPFETIYSGYIKPVATKYNLVMKRGDNFFAAGSIMRDIWSGMFNSYLVIAECTGRNPNVFYELGMAHALNKPGILLTQDIGDIPFDIRSLRHIRYDYTPEGCEKLRRDLERALVKLLFGEDLE